MAWREARRMKRASLVVGVVLFVGLAVGLSGQTTEGLAELHVQKIVLEPPSVVTRGEDVQIYVRIANTGTRSAEHFSVGFYYRPARDGEPWILLGTLPEQHLGPSQQDFLEETFDFETLDMELGTYEIKVVADVAGQIPEVDELNNELKTSMTLIESTLGLPELQPTRLTFLRPAGGNDMAQWGIELAVANTGEYVPSSFTVSFTIDGAATGIVAQGFVPSTGDETVVNATLDPHALELEPGTHQVTAIVDYDDRIAEQDEGNNTVRAWITIQALELHPISLRFDQPVVRLDEEVRVTSEIANDGNGVAKAVKVDFYINHLRFATAQIDQLAADPQEVSVTLAPDRLGLTDAPKVYEISVVVDPDNSLSESDEANNEIVHTLTILQPLPKKPELHPESLVLSPASPAEQGRADVVTVSSVVRNTGRSGSGPFSVGFYYRVKGGRRWVLFPCSDPSGCSEIELAGGSDTTLVGTLSVLTLSPGIYEIRVLTDVDSVVDELDETNNEMVTTLTLLASRLPDLAFCPEGGVVREPIGNVQQGQTIRLSACITNLGEQSAGPFTVRFSYCPLSTPVEGTTTAQCSELYSQSFFMPAPEVTIPGLGIGESVTVPVILESRELLPRQYRIRVEIDPAGAVRERDPFNNTYEMQVTVLGPDLTIATLAASPAGDIDQTKVDTVEVAATVLNIGVVPTGEFTVRFRLSRVDELGTVPVRVHSCDDTDGSSCHEADYFGAVTLSGIGVLVPELVRCPLDLEEADLPPGQYIITVEVDCEGDVDGDGVCEGRVAEHNELNNKLQIPIVLVGTRLPDLTVDSLTTEPAAIADWPARGSIDVIATISNIGVKAADPFDVLLRVFRIDPAVDCDGRVPLECAELVYSGTKSLIGMIRDDVRDVVWSLERSVLQEPGTYILRVDVDCDRIVEEEECVGRVVETNEANNSAELTYEIVAGPHFPPWKPCVGECVDLRVRSLSARLESGGSGTARVIATIENIGTVDAGPFTVAAYYIPAHGAVPTAIVDTSHPARYVGLAANRTATFRQDFDASALPNGFYDVFVVVDVDNEVIEANEKNNTRDGSLWIH